MKKTIEVKYDFNKTYYYNKMISIPSIAKCQYCVDGKHTRIGDGKVVDCPKCKGEGEYDTGSGRIKEEVHKCELFRIIITENGTNYEFIDSQTEEDVYNTNVYESKKKCEENKSKGIMGYGP